ncbi:type VI secretion system baseplate subunit TssF [Bordetella avium]|uniref:type VI secretion system baseplate subunit TssF n=1 Tax=Bordetella avium TaxID=521 RepID=UPI000E6A457A|nr:type VI secretion system baseplate subunit TssF [Bordetella avium]RIQ41302.1 type VI secretion system baseplate subunit TssF [Bordetella avium]RIQ45911.1 type VI secretion system baseplate subunit TssF [Bordetella avium]RIQ46837.1 type VI secretion system baseplate subunit TssF [Bordetella avium]RIQ49639.1 type VI secretion system baseplate subunit TssF [Bordetella avium]RIQ61418.1 type VI secretion system baseplate subunit TssF [Bordetella avium]
MLSDEFLKYYRRELAYLREQGADFAQRYPKVAGKLGLHGGESPDPHVERLLESFAFLSARVHREIDQTLPQLASDLLENLCPALALPVPSMSIAQLHLELSQGKVTAGFSLPKGAELVARSAGKENCRFQTVWDSRLWPLHLRGIRSLDERTLSLELEADAGLTLAELDIRSLRVHLAGDWMEAAPLYEWLVGGVIGTDLIVDDHRVSAGEWREVGFDHGEEALPRHGYAHPAHLLLQEIFAFPRKFHFFDLGLPQGLPLPGSRCEIRVNLRRPLRGNRGPHEGSFKLGCVPIVNLFGSTSEPVALDQKAYEYPLSASWQDSETVEIFRVEKVYLSDPMAERTVEVPNFSSQQHLIQPEPPMFWTSRRQLSFRPNGGTDTFISFIDSRQRAMAPAVPVAYANLWCTNRRLAEQVPAGVSLLFEKVRSNLSATCLYEPTAQRDPPLDAGQLWQLAAFVTSQQQSLFEPGGSSQRLQDLMRLFAGSSAREIGMIQGLLSAQATEASIPVSRGSWRGYQLGTDVTLEFDPQAYVGSSPLLLAAGLARFFALTTSINSFVRTQVRLRDEIWRAWPPMSGYEAIL